MTIEMLHPWRLLLLLPPALAAVWWVSRRTLTDFSAWQTRAMTAVRSLIVVLLVLALTGVHLTRPTSRTAIVVVADVSQSVTDEALTLSNALARAVAESASGPVSVVTFDNEPRLTTFPDDADAPVIVRKRGQDPFVRSTLRAYGQKGPDPFFATDIASALCFANAMVPAGYVGRIVLITDGRETTGSMIDEVASPAGRALESFVLAVPPAPGPEIIVAGLEVPASPTPGATAELRTRVLSTHDADASIEVFVDGFRLGEPRGVRLKRGENVLTSAVGLPKSGSHECTVRLTSASDTYAGNNTASQVVVLPREVRVLVVEEREEDAKFLARALRDAGLTVDVRTSSGFPTDIVDLDRYACVVLSDVPATSLAPAQLEMLKRYVEDLGGGFVMVGGEASFGLGGYFRTPVEEILPVRLDVDKKKEQPTLAMMLLLDKSGSMQGRKVDLAKEAAIATLDLMGPEDLVGVVTFDTQEHLVVPLERATNRSKITGTVSGITAAGGTNMYPALELAHRELRRAQARVKHVILLTDGKTHDADYASQARRMARDQITVSCVAVGGEADVALLQNVARWGRGRFYYTRDALSIPQIFARETVTASQSAVIEEPFQPRVVRDVEMIRGLDFTDAPYLLGYVSTVPKPLSEVILVSERAEPVLVRWRHGLGKTVAFTSDVKNRWSAEWLSWAGFGKFWAQLVRDTLRTHPSGTADVRLTFDDTLATVTVDAADAAGRLRNRLVAGASVISPGGGTLKVALRQEAPGRYRGVFTAPDAGTYVVSARLGVPGDDEGTGDVVVVGRTKPRPAEYASLDVDRDALTRLARTAGGDFLDADEWTRTDEDLSSAAARLVAPTEKHVTVRQTLWPLFLWTALALFFVDLVSRRVDFASLTARRRTGGAG
ncbi:MAG TPA: VWA domain-containing protein [Planctomycetota bacterium]|nr:VWA domain-containing protein [Planctomycetota bacterium]